MRSFSFFTIFILCLVLLSVDAVSFYWLQSITRLINYPVLKTVINILFWVFSCGLISSILILKIRMDDINPQRKHLLATSLFGITVASFIPKLIFIIVISVLYFANHIFSERESLIVIPIAGLFSGLMPFTVILYSIFRSLYRFKVHHVTINSNKLSESTHKITVVQISDMHLGSFNFRYHILDRAIALINQLEPDFILFTGDIVNNHAWELKGWDTILSKLEAKRGKYAVLGNHDYGDYSVWKSPKDKKKNLELIRHFYKKIGFRLLMNESEILKFNGDALAIIGVENWGMPPFKKYGNLKKAMATTDHADFKILLSHDPSHWEEEVLKHTDIDLTLSGHTHGMQAGINFKNKMWSPIKFKYKYWLGLYQIDKQYLYVNRGLGWLGFPGRLGMRPEITCIELKNS